jgi:hypothetical protein
VGKRHVASLNHGDRSMMGPACGVVMNSHSPCALKPVDAEEVHAELDGALRVSDGGCACECEVAPRKLLSHTR